MNGIREFLSRREFHIFGILVLANAGLLIGYRYFPTTDGPAHVYNARLLLDLIANAEHSSIANFFQINSSNFTNLLGHALMALFMLAMPGWMAQKLLMLVYMVGLPFAFRFFIKQINPRQLGFSFLVFPFTYSFLFVFGFFNFSLGLVFLFWGMGLWLNWLKNGQINRVGFIAIAAAIFFSHLFVFAVFALFIGISLLSAFIYSGQNKATFWKLFKPTAVALAPFIALFLYYFFQNPVSNGQSSYLTLYDRVFMILSADAAKSFSFGTEGNYTRWFFVGFAILLANSLYQLLKTRFAVHQNTLGLMLTTATLVACYFLLPNQTGGFAGFITPRFLLLFFLVGIGFFAAIETHAIVQTLVVAIFLFFSVLLLRIYQPIIQAENTRFLAMEDAATHITKGAVVVPITQSNQRYHAHFSNVLGYEKPVVITENYEATLPYFPVLWNADRSPEITVPNNISRLPFPLNQGEVQQPADFIFLLSDSEITQKLNPRFETLQNQYTLVFSWKSELFLFQRNTNL